jgi:hypothetical protein
VEAVGAQSVARGPDSVPDGLDLEAAARDLDAERALGPVGRWPRARGPAAAENAYWQVDRLSRIPPRSSPADYPPATLSNRFR